MKCFSLIVLLSLGVFSFHKDLAFAEQDSCRRLKFSSPVEGFALEGHVIKNISLSLGLRNSCKGRCTMERHCVSINIGPTINDHVLCQLSDSDRILHPDDLRPKEGFTYRDTENECSSSPCVHNATCLHGFTDKRYKCLCPIGYTGGNCEIVVSTCKEMYDRNILKMSQLVTLKVDSKLLSVYCHIGDFGCGDGGWTPVMKIDGNENTFHYDSEYWNDRNGYNLPGGETGFDTQETKLPTYWNTPFTKICVGMKIGEQINFLILNKRANSLYSLIADGQHNATSISRSTWKKLVGPQASLQGQCNKQGINVVSTDNSYSKARIGILGQGNEGSQCYSCESRIGFGTGGKHDDSNTCGNEATGDPDNGDKHIKAMGYILVR